MGDPASPGLKTNFTWFSILGNNSTQSRSGQWLVSLAMAGAVSPGRALEAWWLPETNHKRLLMQEECFLLSHGTLIFPRGEGLGLFFPLSSSPYGLCVHVLSQLLSSCLWMLKETECNSVILKSHVCYIC